MEYIGDASLWRPLFPDDLMPQILDLVVDTWTRFCRPKSTEKETWISEQFCRALRASKLSKKLPFHISLEYPALGSIDSGFTLIQPICQEENASEFGDIETHWQEDKEKEKGRIDIVFSHGYREDVYFSLECKRLNVASNSKSKSLAGEYVTQGLKRYAEEKYAKGLDKGGMIGYVMDGNVHRAIASVDGKVREHRISLRIPLAEDGLRDSSLQPVLNNVRETRHVFDSGQFVVHHVFLAWPRSLCLAAKC
jgi:hypothetical protein